jgi:hypothetical protein
MGGEWGGRWTNFPDRPHFQMTFGATIVQMQAGHKVPENSTMLWETQKKEEKKMVYRTVKEMPDWAQPGIQQLIDMGVLSGRAPDNLDIDENMMRTLLIVRNMFDRANLLDKMCS